MNNDFDALLDEIDQEPADEIKIINLDDEEIDPRLKLLSHSSRTTLHQCPRKYQLYRLSSNKIDPSEEQNIKSSVTLAFGQAVGTGVQSVFENKSEEQIFLDVFLAWDTDLLDELPRDNKSFWSALFFTKQFMAMREAGFLDDYELVYYNDKPAVELGFKVDLPNGFSYRGFVDVVLRHKVTGEVMVVELKTTKFTANPAMYQNSGQGLGYSVVLDILFPDLSSYTVLYLVCETKSKEFKELPFKKSLLQRALWLQELLIECNKIEVYEQYNTYPMHGESCFDFYRECEYLGICTLNTDHITKPLTDKLLEEIEEDHKRYEFAVDFYDLVQQQIDKGEQS